KLFPPVVGLPSGGFSLLRAGQAIGVALCYLHCVPARISGSLGRIGREVLLIVVPPCCNGEQEQLALAHPAPQEPQHRAGLGAAQPPRLGHQFALPLPDLSLRARVSAPPRVVEGEAPVATPGGGRLSTDLREATREDGCSPGVPRRTFSTQNSRPRT